MINNKGIEKLVYIIDDDTSLLEALSFMLTTEGYRVVVGTGETVLEEVKQYQPQIILLDILLAHGNGRDICKKIKQKKDLQHIPIILLSAHPNAGKTYKQYLANAFLAKPFDNEDLLALIMKLIL